MMLGTNSPQLRAAAFAMLLLFVGSGVCQNIDTAQPIVRSVPGGQIDEAYFGYTLVLHQTASNPGNMANAVSGARIIVSAPNGTAPNGERNTGVVYSCPVTPGTCTGLPGKLFDETPNNNDENKTDQFLGASMASNGDRFIVCAHRYTRIFNGISPLPLGKCFFSNRDLQSFTEYQPCSQQTGQLATFSVGVCEAGISSTIVPDGGSFAFGLGAPGVANWAGAVIRRNRDGGTNIQSTSTSSERNAYQGYAIVGGRFITRNRQDFAVSLPRRNSYFGSVNLVMNSNNLQFTSQPLMGMQMGEYYGFSLLAVDLNGDDFDELLVSAPLFRANSTEPETGRVYIYRNTGGNLEFVRTIEGRTRYSRFGYAMANLGDINGDGLDDVAISAPFTETGNTEPGTVYIYHSTPTLLLTSEPQQIIRGTDLSLTLDLSGLRGFGTSLASGVDVDENSYNDLLIGSFQSQQAFLLRTRPLARVQTTVTAEPQIVDVMGTSRAECMLNGTAYACFTVTACATYTGTGLMNSLPLTFTVTADTQSVEQRLIFANNSPMESRTVSADVNVQTCPVFTAYIRNMPMINDVFNPFIMDVRIDTPPRNVAPGNGNQQPDNLSDSPVVSQFGSTQVQVETLKECDGGVCIPDLRVSVMETRIIASDRERTPLNSIVAGFTSTVEFDLTVNNPGEDAFQASLSFVLPANVLELVNVFNQTSNGEVSLSCSGPEVLVNDQNEPLDMIRHTCSIGNPFSGPGMIQLRVQLTPRSSIMGNEDAVSINFTVSSINPENQETITDNSNFALAQMTIEARADISIDDGVVTPTQISYSDNTQLAEGTELTDVSQLGPAVDVSFLIRNSGPSVVPSIDLEIMWPLSSTLTGENYYLYITSIQSTGGASVTCSSEFINPQNLAGDLGDQEGGDPTVSMGTGRRKKRSTVKRTLRNKRQEAPTEQQISQNVTLSCASGSPILNCVPITCTLLGLSGSDSTQIDINSRLDERFFSTNNDRYVFIPSASVSIATDAQFIQPNNPDQDPSERMANAQIRVIPAARVTTVGESTPVPWWAIFVPILAAVIIITVVAVLLWVFGFFRRRKHEELKQRREELQNLQDNGVSPADGAGF